MREKPSKVFGVNGALQVRKATPRVVVHPIHNSLERLLVITLHCTLNPSFFMNCRNSQLAKPKRVNKIYSKLGLYEGDRYHEQEYV